MVLFVCVCVSMYFGARGYESRDYFHKKNNSRWTFAGKVHNRTSRGKPQERVRERERQSHRKRERDSIRQGNLIPPIIIYLGELSRPEHGAATTYRNV